MYLEIERAPFEHLRKVQFLPLLFPILDSLETLGGETAGIAEATHDAKANKLQLEEQKK